jgi:hypothetical protein
MVRRSEPGRLASKMNAPTDDDDFFSLRRRAYELAETGRYKHWAKVAGALQSEGFAVTQIERLDRDTLAVMMITRCCAQSRQT